MKLSGKVLSSLFFLFWVSGNVAVGRDIPETDKKTDALSHLFDFEKKAFQKTYASLPPDIRAFERLDFDARMERQEYLRLKYGDQLFMDTLRYRLLKQNNNIEAVVMAVEIVALGRPVATLKPDSSIREVAKICGLKRLCALMDAKKRGQSFWPNKDCFYRDALSAEMVALNEAGSLFDVFELMGLRQAVSFGSGKESSDLVSNSYHEAILKRAQKRLNLERQLYARQPLPEQHH